MRFADVWCLKRIKQISATYFQQWPSVKVNISNVLRKMNEPNQMIYLSGQWERFTTSNHSFFPHLPSGQTSCVWDSSRVSILSSVLISALFFSSSSHSSPHLALLHFSFVSSIYYHQLDSAKISCTINLTLALHTKAICPPCNFLFFCLFVYFYFNCKLSIILNRLPIESVKN